MDKEQALQNSIDMVVDKMGSIINRIEDVYNVQVETFELLHEFLSSVVLADTQSDEDEGDMD